MAEFDIDRKLLDKLVRTFKDAELTDLEFCQGDTKVRLRKRVQQAAVAVTTSHAPAPVAAGPSPEPASAPAATTSEPSENAITSPMVGTAYLSPEPGKPPFVKEGAKVKEGDTLLIIEAMKVMNNLTAPRSGTVSQILISDGSPVEFGQPLVVID